MTGRSAIVKQIDRVFTRLTRAIGRLVGRPDEGLLHELTGRSKGGPPDVVGNTGYVQHLERGRRAVETGAFGEALHHFSQAAQARPEEAWPWHGRGDALQLSGDFAAALEAYDAALERVGLPLAHNGRGNALEGLGRLEEARAAWTKALELDPKLSWPRQSLDRTA